MLSLCCILALLASFCPDTSGTTAGVKVKLTQKGLEYGQKIGIPILLKKLKAIDLPEMNGSVGVFLIGRVAYSLTGMKVLNVRLPQSAVGLVPGIGVSLIISDGYIDTDTSKYFLGTFDLSVCGLTITTTITIKSDGTGRPMVRSANCEASLSHARIRLRGGASWLYNMFNGYINKKVRKELQRKICPLVSENIQKINSYMKTLNVLKKIDRYAEIEYGLTESPVVSVSSTELSLKGEFYNIGVHKKPAFAPTPFSLPPNERNMLYMGISAFTANSAGFVYKNAGALRLRITDKMIPRAFPYRLNTKTFEALIPQIAKQYPNMMMKLLVKAATAPTVTFAPNNVTLQANTTVTVYAIQPNTTLTTLFILNVVGNKGQNKGRWLGSLTFNDHINLNLGTSYIGPFKVKPLASFLQIMLKIVIPHVNVILQRGFPLPNIANISLVKPRLVIMKDYVLIGTDVQFKP
uniref:Bactericidal permeability-increasing protein n=1 Tax=Electrophorus electricus TaxID=8005 RepID=A0AAY5EHC6_ELEEL